VQARYARTDALNVNPYVTGDYCVRFDERGVPAQVGGSAVSGQVIYYGQGGSGALIYDIAAATDGDPLTNPLTGISLPPPVRSPLWAITNFRIFLGYKNGSPPQEDIIPFPGGGAQSPYYIADTPAGGPIEFPAQFGATDSTPPSLVSFENAIANYIRVYTPGVFGGPTNHYWLLYSITLTADFSDPGTPATLPEVGRNSYAFLNNLPAAAQDQIRSSFGTQIPINGTQTGVFGAIVDQSTGTLALGPSLTAAGGVSGGAFTGLDVLFDPNTPCLGYTAMRKIWNPQIERKVTNKSEPWSATAGVRGRFGGDWRWESYVQYGKTQSSSVQYNVSTNLRMAMANDAVIDDRIGSPTYGTPVCRVVRDGVPIVDYLGRAVSEPEALQDIASGCQPLNVFGSEFANSDIYMPGYEGTNTYNPYQLQQAALDYAFVPTYSSGWNDLAVLNFNTSGTIWGGIGAGPLTGALGVEVSQNRTVNSGTQGTATFYERADLANSWADAFGGKTRSTEAYTELNLPIISGVEGINLLSLNVGGRFTSYYNKGGAGTSGQDSTQNVFNWKFQTVFEPFEWVRLRMTRSRDQRAAGFRDLFIQQPGLPDQFSGENPWRPYNPDSTEGRQERWGQTRVGNPRLNPEKSDTLTLGMVLSPGGWAQGMRFSLDYFDIRIKDSISTPFISSTTATIQQCWEGSGNEDGLGTVEDPLVNGLFNYDYYDPELQSYPCQEIEFGVNPDGSRNLQDIVNYNSARPVNSTFPTQRRGMDLSLNYNFPLNRLFESLPGSMAITVRGTRALEASGYQLNSGPPGVVIGLGDCNTLNGTFNDNNCYIPINAVGQIRSSVFVPGVAASPKWTGNFQFSYLMGDLTTTLSARYIGAALLDNTWCDPEQAAQGCNAYTTTVLTPDGPVEAFVAGSVDDNSVKPYFNFALNGSYNLQVGNMRQFQIFGSINNLFDKSPPFTGGGLSGASSGYHDILGRAYRFGVRMKF
jgi:outer membrane receptor protein involved in Fe transport